MIEILDAEVVQVTSDPPNKRRAVYLGIALVVAVAVIGGAYWFTQSTTSKTLLCGDSIRGDTTKAKKSVVKSCRDVLDDTNSPVKKYYFEGDGNFVLMSTCHEYTKGATTNFWTPEYGCSGRMQRRAGRTVWRGTMMTLDATTYGIRRPRCSSSRNPMCCTPCTSMVLALQVGYSSLILNVWMPLQLSLRLFHHIHFHFYPHLQGMPLQLPLRLFPHFHFYPHLQGIFTFRDLRK